MGGLKSQGNLVFGLDIGTRSIVGTVGFEAEDGFHVLAQEVREHESRAMLDGQIHDIGRVGQTILAVKNALEERLGRSLTEVCIAAAGRVLKTVTVGVSLDFDSEQEVRDEDIYNLSMSGIEQAYSEFQNENDTDMKFYCVGYTPMRYYLNGYQIGNLNGHKAKKIGADLIATFLPDDVVDGLYKSTAVAGLHVANLTLEPIAAIQVAIPEKFRLLNLALVDVGAGTSDISITKDGSIIAYGMIPVAGDSLTDVLVQKCLVDFDMAEHIKKSLCEDVTEIAFTDIMGLSQKISAAEVREALDPHIDEMTDRVAEEIRRLNGDKPVSAVFVVGGGGIIPGYTEKLSEKLGILKERVAIRGEEVMKDIIFEDENARKDSLMVTPIGIALSFYAQSNNFIFVSFNGEKLKLYDNGHLTVSDAAVQMSYPNEDLFPKRGKALTFTIGGKSRIVRGTEGESSVILINGEAADLYTQIHSGDEIEVKASTPGEDASFTLGELTELKTPVKINVNSRIIEFPKKAVVNGKLQEIFYKVCEGDDINVNNYYTVSQIAEFLDVSIDGDIKVNSVPAGPETKVYEDFNLDFKVGVPEIKTSAESENADDVSLDGSAGIETGSYDELPDDDGAAAVADLSITVIANGRPYILTGKQQYVFVDIFDKLDFDLKASNGRNIVTLLNGRDAQYLEPLKDGDVIEVRWEALK
ncbi:MAG: rod shape-determining protein [Lachnospiraceae bacterium]|nr:rod shape-determining protein [Lachnospiraceae bacterium]